MFIHPPLLFLLLFQRLVTVLDSQPFSFFFFFLSLVAFFDPEIEFTHPFWAGAFYFPCLPHSLNLFLFYSGLHRLLSIPFFLSKSRNLHTKFRGLFWLTFSYVTCSRALGIGLRAFKRKSLHKRQNDRSER